MRMSARSDGLPIIRCSRTRAARRWSVCRMRRSSFRSTSSAFQRQTTHLQCKEWSRKIARCTIAFAAPAAIQYPVGAFPMSPSDWKDHFGSSWTQLRDAKRRHDPGICSRPGMAIISDAQVSCEVARSDRSSGCSPENPRTAGCVPAAPVSAARRAGPACPRFRIPAVRSRARPARRDRRLAIAAIAQGRAFAARPRGSTPRCSNESGRAP